MVRAFNCTFITIMSFAVAATADVIDVKTRDSNIRILVEGPETPTHVIAIFAGGSGNTQIKDDGSIGKGRGNFAVRTRGLLNDHGFATAVVASPDDNKDLRGHRRSDDYATDVENVMAYLRKRFQGVSLWMHGTSRGTISIAMTVPKFKNAANKPDGIVLSASVTEPSNASADNVYDADLGNITGAVLVLHHKEDPCYITPASNTPKLLKDLTKASPKKLMILEGGGQNARGGECGAKTQHGFIDMEKETIDAMVGWIKSLK